jgi:hypothetical protein
MLLGYDQGFVSGLLTLPSFEAQFPQTAGGFQGSTSATLQSFLVAICTLPAPLRERFFGHEWIILTV